MTIHRGTQTGSNGSIGNQSDYSDSHENKFQLSSRRITEICVCVVPDSSNNLLVIENVFPFVMVTFASFTTSPIFDHP